MRLGMLAVAASAVLFSAKAVFIKLCYAHGTAPVALMTLRSLFCLPFFLGMAVYSGLKGRGKVAPLSPRDLASVAGLGLLGFYVSGLCNMTGLQYVSAGMERMILYVYPTLVVLFSSWALRKPLAAGLVAPLVLSYAGVALSFGAEAFAGGGSRPFLGGGLIFASAVCYAVFLVIQGRIIHRVGAQRITSYAMLFATGAVLLQFGLTLGWADLRQPPVVLLLAGLTAVFCTVAPSYLLAWGVQRIGTGPAAVVSTVGPVSTFVLAVLLLGEKAGLPQILGLCLVIAGGLMLGAGKTLPTAGLPASAARWVAGWMARSRS
jgi:drug/metabolite transporter (DMT)-like permease